MCESFEEGLLGSQCLTANSLLGFGWNVVCWCSSEACKYSITSAIVMVAAMISCSTAILGIERFTSAFTRKVYEQMVALIQSRSLELRYQNF